MTTKAYLIYKVTKAIYATYGTDEGSKLVKELLKTFLKE